MLQQADRCAWFLEIAFVHDVGMCVCFIRDAVSKPEEKQQGGALHL